MRRAAEPMTASTIGYLRSRATTAFIVVDAADHAKARQTGRVWGLHGFLERGYAAFRMMRGRAEFLIIVADLELKVSHALLADDDSVLA
jgi:hypothetical protein